MSAASENSSCAMRSFRLVAPCCERAKPLRRSVVGTAPYPSNASIGVPAAWYKSIPRLNSKTPSAYHQRDRSLRTSKRIPSHDTARCVRTTTVMVDKATLQHGDQSRAAPPRSPSRVPSPDVARFARSARFTAATRARALANAWRRMVTGVLSCFSRVSKLEQLCGSTRDPDIQACRGRPREHRYSAVAAGAPTGGLNSHGLPSAGVAAQTLSLKGCMRWKRPGAALTTQLRCWREARKCSRSARHRRRVARRAVLRASPRLR